MTDFFRGDRADGLAYLQALGLPLPPDAPDVDAETADDPWAPPTEVVGLGMLEPVLHGDHLPSHHPMTHAGYLVDPLSALPALVIHFQARAVERALLPPFIGSTLRGAIGQSLRAVACTTRAPTCHGCPVAATCAYGMIWEGAGARAQNALDRGGDAPRPYVLAWERPPSRQRAPTPHLMPGDTLRFRLTLLGPARHHAATMISAIERALRVGLGTRKARFQLEWATIAGLTDLPGQPSGRAMPLFANGALTPFHALPDTTVGALAEATMMRLGPSLRISIQTPMHLVDGGRALDHIRLDTLVQRLSERIQRMAQAWGLTPELAPLPWERLVAMARDVRILRTHTDWVSFERESSRQHQRVPMEGLVGHVDVTDVPAELAFILAAAEYIHLGKQAAFGFGRITLRKR